MGLGACTDSRRADATGDGFRRRDGGSPAEYFAAAVFIAADLPAQTRSGNLLPRLYRADIRARPAGRIGAGGRRRGSRRPGVVDWRGPRHPTDLLQLALPDWPAGRFRLAGAFAGRAQQPSRGGVAERSVVE